jgi:hypothetical protein
LAEAMTADPLSYGGREGHRPSTNLAATFELEYKPCSRGLVAQW